MILYNFYYSDFKFLLNEITFISLVILSLCFYTFYENKILLNSNKIITYSVSLYLLFIISLYNFLQFYEFDCFYILFNFGFSNSFIFKSFKFFLISLIFLIIYCFISLPDNLIKSIKFEYIYIILFIFIGSFFLIFTNDFLGLFLNLELQNFGFYILFSLNKKKKLVAESNVKYYIYGGISSAFLLYGISLIYGATGQINFNDLIMTLSLIDNNNLLLLLSLIFIFFGLFFKLGIAPFHFWIPGIYENAPTIVTLIFLTLPKFIFFCLFIKFFYFLFYSFNSFLIFLFGICIILSFLFGSLGAMNQFKIKKFMAYSAITNSGFILLGFYTFTFEGLVTSFIYLIIYLILTFTLLYFFISFIPYKNSYSSLNNLTFFNYKSFLLLNPWILFFLSFNLFSMGGIPPLSGFFSKFLLFNTLFDTNNFFMLLVSLIFSLIIIFYYIRIIKILIFTKYDFSYINFYVKIKYVNALILISFTYLNLFFCLNPSIFFDFFYYQILSIFL